MVHKVKKLRETETIEVDMSEILDKLPSDFDFTEFLEDKSKKFEKFSWKAKTKFVSSYDTLTPKAKFKLVMEES